jgi:hypothetical protein
VALDQLTTDCLGLAATFVATMSSMDEARLRRGDTGRGVRRPGRHGRSSFDDDRPPAGRSRAEARLLNARSQAHLQLLVDALRDSRPEPERVYELRVIQDSSPISHQVLCCSDARVVFAEAGEGALRSLTVFTHGTLDVENKLLRARAELRMGPKPVLIWPRLAGDDDEIDLGVRQVMSGPSPALHALQTRVARGERGRITLAAGAPTAGTSTAPGWHPDPTGRHDHRWWDGSTWTANAADDGVAVHDPI